MPNMSYCQFENTVLDMDQCQTVVEGLFNADHDPLSESELRNAKALAQQCRNFLELFADQLGLELTDEAFWDDTKWDEELDSANNDAESTDE